jgi:hypothetical protein
MSPPHLREAEMPLRQALTRSCAQEGLGPRAVVYTMTTFHAFHITQGMKGLKEVALGGRTYDCGRLNAGTLEEALNEALSSKLISHKETLVLQEIGERGVKLHLFAIRRRSQPRYVHKDHVSRRVHDLYPEPVCTLDADLLRSQL